MSPSNVHGFATNRETLLFLAWIAGRPNLSDLQTCQLRGKEPHRVFPAQLTVSLPPIFELDTYGPMYQALFFHRLAEVEWTFVDWAIRGVHAVYLQTDEMPPTGEETTILWETISQQKQIQAEFHQMKEIWLHDPAGLIYHLRAHFQMHQPLLIRSIESAFLVQEFLAISLARVDWRAI